MDTLSRVWETAAQVHPDPHLGLVLAALLLALLLVVPRSVWPVTRNAVTIVHEGAHAVVAVLTGRRLGGIRLHSDTSGVTVTVGKPAGLGMIVTAFAGYPGPALAGLGAAALLSSGRPAGVLYATLLLLAVMAVHLRNLYGVLTVGLTGAVLAGVLRYAPDTARSLFAYLLVWFLLLAGFRPVVELHRKRRAGQAPDSDADQLARLTGLPGIVWTAGFLLVCGACLLLGSAWLVGMPAR